MNRINRKNAVSMEEAMMEFLKATRLGSQHNTHLVFKAWDDASGAAKYTLKRYFRDGKLYITLNSSVIRNQLSFQKDSIVEKINGILRDDELFTRDDPRVSFVKELILK